MNICTPFFRLFHSINRCLSNRFISLVWNSKRFNRSYKSKAFKECVQAFKNKRSSVGTMPRAKSSNWWYYVEQKKAWLQIGMYLNEFLFFEVLFIWCCSWCSHRHRSLFNCHLVLRTRDKFQLNNIQLWTKEEEKFTIIFFRYIEEKRHVLYRELRRTNWHCLDYLPETDRDGKSAKTQQVKIKIQYDSTDEGTHEIKWKEEKKHTSATTAAHSASVPNIALEHNSYYNWTKRAYVWNGRH